MRRAGKTRSTDAGLTGKVFDDSAASAAAPGIAVAGAPAAHAAAPGYPPELGEARYLTREELAQSLDHALSHWESGSDFWIFGYGSLIWRPEMPALEAVKARVPGYHRGLYLWSRANRGTPGQPGLVLALDRGGSCTGIAYRIDQRNLRRNLEALWDREMLLGSYRPAWLRCTLMDGRRIKVLTFVMRRGIPTYAGRLPDHVVRTVFQCACGRYGTTLDYVTRTVEALRASGIRDPALEALLERCR